MIVAIDDDGGVSLDEADDFTRFHVAVSAGFGARSVDAALRSAEAGWAKEDQAYIAPGALLALHPDSDSPWRESLAAMADSARRHGWWDEATASIAAHIVRSA